MKKKQSKGTRSSKRNQICETNQASNISLNSKRNKQKKSIKQVISAKTVTIV